MACTYNDFAENARGILKVPTMFYTFNLNKIPNMSLCIEVKLLRAGRKSRVIEEISADITAYKKIYPHQLFVVYDLGDIQNETEFKCDIEMTDGVKVIIIKH